MGNIILGGSEKINESVKKEIEHFNVCMHIGPV